MICCAISLGGNLGDVPAAFDWACRSLLAHPGIANFAASCRYRTEPMGAAAGNAFLNAAAAFDTDLEPEPLLDALQQIEHTCGRVHTVHWGPRTLDLDLLLYGEEIINSSRLIVPHPALWHRRFVLDPLCELMPDAVHPVFGMSIRELRAQLLPRPLPVCFRGGTDQSVAQPFLPVRADRNGCATEVTDAKSAAIVFASRGADAPWPQVVRLPDDESAAVQTVVDVLTAALDEPVSVS